VPIKPGIKTTELLLTVLTALGAIAAASVGVLPAKWAAVASAVSVVAYNLSRGLAKAGSGGGQ
jgi:hypothetical protein